MCILLERCGRLNNAGITICVCVCVCVCVCIRIKFIQVGVYTSQSVCVTFTKMTCQS